MASIKTYLALGLFVLILNKDLVAQPKRDAEQPLDIKHESIVTISAFTAKGDLVQLKHAMNNGLNAGLTVNEIKEILVHLYAYAGFPRSLNGISTFQTVINERKQKGLSYVVGKETTKTTTVKSKFQYGKDVQTKLTGSTATGAPQKFVPIIDTFLKEHLFADIFRRDALDWKTREIVTISVLASLGNAESQLRSHFKVGLNTGLTEDQLNSIVSVLQKKVGIREGNTAKQVLQSVLNKTTDSSLVDSDVSANDVFPKGTRISNNNFTGTAYLQMLITADSLNQITVGNVTFEPGTRSNWHLHPSGQILLVIDGVGYYQEKGQPKKILRKGEAVKCPRNVPHWHGASAHTAFVQLAITGREKGETVWLEAVSDEEYNR
jgi:4-carboxymuconolactone decarboxylase